MDSTITKRPRLLHCDEKQFLEKVDDYIIFLIPNDELLSANSGTVYCFTICRQKVYFDWKWSNPDASSFYDNKLKMTIREENGNQIFLYTIHVDGEVFYFPEENLNEHRMKDSICKSDVNDNGKYAVSFDGGRTRSLMVSISVLNFGHISPIWPCFSDYLGDIDLGHICAFGGIQLQITNTLYLRLELREKLCCMLPVVHEMFHDEMNYSAVYVLIRIVLKMKIDEKRIIEKGIRFQKNSNEGWRMPFDVIDSDGIADVEWMKYYLKFVEPKKDIMQVSKTIY